MSREHDLESTASDERSLRPSTVIGGAFRVVRFIAEGAMGEVYEATDDAGRRVALKVLRKSSSSGALQRFYRELRLAMTLSHGNIVAIHKGGRDEATGLPFLAMELLEGDDLSHWLRRTGPMPGPLSARIVLDVARGLAAAHEAGVVHRDIKPSNIFMHRAGDVLVPKLCDFGIAKSLDPADPQLTRTGTLVGSPLYMSPEALLRPKEVDARADLWSLGMTLYEMLTGVVPTASATSFSELIAMVDGRDVPHLQERAPWVSGELATVVLGLLVRDVKQRCPSVEELIDRLGPLAGPTPIEASSMRGLDEIERGRSFSPVARPARWESSRVGEVDPLLGKTLGGRYRLEKRLGEGGMGAVYRAEKVDGGGRAAVKVIRPELSGTNNDAIRRFVREARVAMAVKSPHVVRVHEVDTDTQLGVPYIAMDLLEGEDLSTLIERHGALDPSTAAALVEQACRGVAAAHEAGVVHRDIKPANIFLHREGDELVVKVCDFGIAKKTHDFAGDASASADLTRTGGLLGSPMYMSPEQARNAKNVDHRTDIWSLSLSLYEALAGQKPWPSLSSFGEIIYTITTKDVPPLQGVAPWVRPELATIVHRGLSREPDERWGSVTEMADALAKVSSQRLSLSSLAPVSQQIKSKRAEVMPQPTAAVTDPRRETTQASRGGSSKTALLVAVGLVAAAGAAFALRAPATAGPSQPAAEVSAPKAIKARVRVDGEAAEVTVNGAPRPLDDGHLSLEGKVGDTFKVVVSAHGVKLESEVRLLESGLPSPSRIEAPKPQPIVVPASAPADAPSAAPSSPSSRPGAAKAPAGKPSQPVQQPAQQPAQPPPQKPPESGFPAQGSWR